MTNEEAIKKLKEDRALYESDIVEAGDGTPYGQLLLALDMAIEALEKQIPKKPTIDEYDGTYSYICPCEAEVEENQAYCDICGQALEWSDDIN